MSVTIKSLPIGWFWELKTSDGQHYEGVAIQWDKMWDRIWYLNGLVIEHNPKEFA